MPSGAGLEPWCVRGSPCEKCTPLRHCPRPPSAAQNQPKAGRAIGQKSMERPLSPGSGSDQETPRQGPGMAARLSLQHSSFPQDVGWSSSSCGGTGRPAHKPWASLEICWGRCHAHGVLVPLHGVFLARWPCGTLLCRPVTAALCSALSARAKGMLGITDSQAPGPVGTIVIM